MAQAAAHSKAMFLLLLIYCLMYFPLFVGILCFSLFYYALLSVHSSFAIILNRKSKLVALLLLSYRLVATINVLWLFLWCLGIVCSMCLWYFLIILTYFWCLMLVFGCAHQGSTCVFFISYCLCIKSQYHCVSTAS